MKWRVAAVPAWLRDYRRSLLAGDLVAGLIVTVMLVPQSLAYALLAGVPPQFGLYASILPLLAYAVLGSSMTLAVGPVAVAALMTASALAPLAAPGSPEYVVLAAQLAWLSGLMLLVFGAFRLGSLAHFLSHPVVSGFVSGASIVIVIGQIKPLLGLHFSAQGAWDTVLAIAQALPQANPWTSAIGLSALAALVGARRVLSAGLQRVGVAPARAQMVARLAPLAVVVGAALVVSRWQLDALAGVAVVGAIPPGLPALRWVTPSVDTVSVLWLPALLIGVVGFVESVSMAHSLAQARRQRIDADQELLGLGAANVASAVCGGFPVTGGFARSVVNFSAGANTPLSGVVSAGLIALVLVVGTTWFEKLPHAALAATIIVAVSGLVDVGAIRKSWRYDRAEAVTLLVTLLGVVVLGVEQGVLSGVLASFAVLVWRSSRPHMAVVGRVPGTEHFRNIERHQVETAPGLLAVRIDENLFFGNAGAVEARLRHLLDHTREIDHLLMILSAVNRIDTTALDMLTELEHALSQAGITLSFAEVKGPVAERLEHTALGQRMAGRIWLSTHQAFLHHVEKVSALKPGQSG